MHRTTFDITHNATHKYSDRVGEKTNAREIQYFAFDRNNSGKRKKKVKKNIKCIAAHTELVKSVVFDRHEHDRTMRDVSHKYIYI